MLTDGRTDERTDDGRKVITIAHPQQISGELIKNKMSSAECLNNAKPNGTD